MSEPSFDRLLEWLDDGANSQGRTYVEMRRRLVEYFDRKNCSHPDDRADETLNRVARRLDEEGSITGTAPARYCYIVARYVFLEVVHEAQRNPVSLEGLPDQSRSRALRTDQNQASEAAAGEKRLACLDRCLQGLEPNHRELIFGYYQGEQRAKIEGRRRLAERLGMTANALSIRACRIRGTLEACVRQCMEAADQAARERSPGSAGKIRTISS